MNDDTAKPDMDSGDAASREAGRFAEKLQQDVRIWSANEDDASDRHADAAQQMAAKQIKAATETVRKRTTKPKAVAEAPAARKAGPFSMSYDGQTTAQHLAARRALGAR
jgi:hypothetical protein